MTTFYDPAKVRALAEAGDPFWKGAAWILDQQDAARIDTTDYDSEWSRNEVAVSPHSEETRRARDMSEAMLGRMDFALDAYRSRTASTDRERVAARSLGLPYPARLDVDPR